VAASLSTKILADAALVKQPTDRLLDPRHADRYGQETGSYAAGDELPDCKQLQKIGEGGTRYEGIGDSPFGIFGGAVRLPPVEQG
jgi:hypothetical protein